MIKKKECKKGFNCGATCIEKADNCVKELTGEAAELADKFVDMIKGQKSDTTKKKGMQFLDSINEAEALLERGEELSNDNIDNLKREAAKQGDFIKLVQGESLPNLMSEAETDAFADAVMFALPSKLQQAIGKNGSPGAYWVGKDKDGKDLFKSPKEVTAEDIRNRGREVIKRYVAQGGIDAYTLGEEPFSIHDMDVEHVRPLADSAKGDLKANDSPDNWVLIRGGLNKLRSSKNLVDFTKSAERWAKLTPEQKKAELESRAQKKLGSAAIKKAEYNKLLGGDDTVASGKALEAQTVHQLGAKTFGRMSKSRESAGRGASNMPSALREVLVEQAIGERKSRKGNAGDYDPNMSEDDFKAYYKTFMSGPDKVLAKERLAQHNNKDVDLKPYLEQDSITQELNSELLGPIRDARNTRLDNFKSQGMSYEEAQKIEQDTIAEFLESKGVDKSKIEQVVNSL